MDLIINIITILVSVFVLSGLRIPSGYLAHDEYKISSEIELEYLY